MLEFFKCSNIDIIEHDNLIINVHDKQIKLHKNSYISKLYFIDKQQCIDNLINGWYLFIDNKFIDLRYNNYEGYILTDREIDKLTYMVGFRSDIPSYTLDALQLNNLSHSNTVTMSNTVLSRTFDFGTIDLYWYWSPFSRYIKNIYKITTDYGEIYCNKSFEFKKPNVRSTKKFILTESAKTLDLIVEILNEQISILDERYANITDQQFVYDIAYDYTEFDYCQILDCSNGNINLLDFFNIMTELSCYYENRNNTILTQLLNNVLWNTI